MEGMLPVEVYEKVLSYVTEEDLYNLQFVSKDFRQGVLSLVENVLVGKYAYNAESCPRFVLSLFKNLGIDVFEIDHSYFLKTSKNFNKKVLDPFLPYCTQKFTDFWKGLGVEVERKKVSSIFSKGINKGEKNLDKISYLEMGILKNHTKNTETPVQIVSLSSIFGTYPYAYVIDVCTCCPSFVQIGEIYIPGRLWFAPFDTLAGSSMVPYFERKCGNDHIVYKKPVYNVSN